VRGRFVRADPAVRAVHPAAAGPDPRRAPVRGTQEPLTARRPRNRRWMPPA
jgi:hypothetical protein